MKEQEVIKWFWDKYNSCYPVAHTDYTHSIFMFYDPQFIRKIKLCKLSGTIVNPSKVSGICLFEQDWENKVFYSNYDEIYQFLYDNYHCNYNKIRDFIKDRLNDADKLSRLTTTKPWVSFNAELNEADKLSRLTTNLFAQNSFNYLNESDKLTFVGKEY